MLKNLFRPRLARVSRRVPTGLLRDACVAGLAVLAAATSARADLVVGVDDPLEPLWLIDTDTNTYTPLLSAFGGQAIANDAATGTLYFMTNTVTLYSWAYGLGGQPQLIGNTSSSTSNPFLSLTGLGFDPVSNRLLATRTLDSSAGAEGLWDVSTTNGFSTLVGAFSPASAWDMGGFDIDPVSGRAFGFSDNSNRGIYEVNLGNGALTFIAPVPPQAENPPDIDGVAVGGGKIYLVEDRAAQSGGLIHVYDIASGQYEAPLVVPWFFAEVFSGATWVPDSAASLLVPEPGSAGLLMAGLAMLGLRRRRPSEGPTVKGQSSPRIAQRLAVATACAVPAIGLVSSASAQLVVGSGSLDEPAYLGDLSTQRPGPFPVPADVIDWTSLPLQSGSRPALIQGMTADEVNGRLLYGELGPRAAGFLPSSNIWSLNYGSNPNAPDFLGRTIARANGFEIGFQGLALDTSETRLFGAYNIGGTPGKGIYEIDIANPVGSGTSALLFADLILPFAALPGGESAYDIGSLDYDPVTDAVYFYNNDNGPDAPRGIYRANISTGTVDFIVAGPTHRRIENDIGGLAAGDGMIFLSTDEPGFVYVYDLINGGPYDDFLAPFTLENGLFGGAAYAPGMIPEPGSIALTAIGGLALLRRRRA